MKPIKGISPALDRREDKDCADYNDNQPYVIARLHNLASEYLLYMWEEAPSKMGIKDRLKFYEELVVIQGFLTWAKKQ